MKMIEVSNLQGISGGSNTQNFDAMRYAAVASTFAGGLASAAILGIAATCGSSAIMPGMIVGMVVGVVVGISVEKLVYEAQMDAYN